MDGSEECCLRETLDFSSPQMNHLRHRKPVCVSAPVSIKSYNSSLVMLFPIKHYIPFLDSSCIPPQMANMKSMTSKNFLFLLVLFIAPMFSVSMADKQKHSDCGNYQKEIVVGGSERWRFGFNYTDWAIKNGPFYINDKLVFKYDAPNATTFPHNVYLLRNLRSFRDCDFRRAKMVGNVRQGVGKGLKFALRNRKNYYFACGEGNGVHCRTGQMKFSVRPIHRLHSP